MELLVRYTNIGMRLRRELAEGRAKAGRIPSPSTFFAGNLKSHDSARI